MSSTFFGINTAYSALDAQRRAMDVLGYNIAHANDPTFKRQRMVLSENAVLAQSQDGSSGSVSPFGAGVSVGDVERIRDSLIENRIRLATETSANWEYQAQTMRQIESTLGEPSDTGLQADLDRFWDSWSKVATSPESLPIRSTLLEDTAALCQRIQYQYKQMSNTVDDLNMAAEDRLNQINVIGQELAGVNTALNGASGGDIRSNDLLNRRDALVLELSKLVNITQHGDNPSSFVVSIGGRVFVQGNQAFALKKDIGPTGNVVIKWASDDQDAIISSGVIKAITDLRDTIIPGYMAQLDNIAQNLVAKVNAVHVTGKTLTGADGGDFFRDGSTAADISLDDAIIGHPELLAAATTVSKGNGDNANIIAMLKQSQTANSLTINDLYRALVSDIGTSSTVAERQSAAQKMSLDQYNSQQQSVSGVSLDEEMTNMIKFQQAYNAAARSLSVMDEMLGQLIERTGAVGR